MRKIISTLICFFVMVSAGTNSASAQDSVEFAAAELSEISRQYAGSAQNWSIVTAVADFDATTNRFTIGSEARRQLTRFTESWQIVDQGRFRHSELISEGATVFAAPELRTTDSLFILHRRSVNDGNIDEAIRLAGNIDSAISHTETVVKQRRLADVEARLDEFSGSVQRREGLLGSWMDAVRDMLFRESDGIRTGAQSLARLVFTDGSDVLISENATAVIRRSTLDRLTQRSDVDIEVTDGGVLTRLSATARDRSNYTVRAGSSVSTVRSNQFWAEKQSEEAVSLSNFDGEVIVEAENSEVSLEQNMGTIVVRGQEPMTPVSLLPAPRLPWAISDSVVYQPDVNLAWNRLDGALRYEVDLAPVNTFDRDVQTFRTQDNEVLIAGLDEGISYIRIRGYDENGLRGINSRTYRLLRIEDDSMPPVILFEKRSQLFTTEDSYLLEGMTDPGSDIRINGARVTVDENGLFSHRVPVSDDLEEVTVSATNPAGVTRELTRHISRISESRMLDLSWSVSSGEGWIRRASQISVSGRAYEPLKIHVRAGVNVWIVPAGSRGDWALSFRPGEASFIEIRFVLKDTGETVLQRQFEVR